MTDENADMADLIDGEKLDSILQRLAGLEAHGVRAIHREEGDEEDRKEK